MRTMPTFPNALSGAAAVELSQELVKLESGDVSIFVHGVRIEAPVRNNQSQIHSAVQKVLTDIKGTDPSAQSNDDEPLGTKNAAAGSRKSREKAVVSKKRESKRMTYLEALRKSKTVNDDHEQNTIKTKIRKLG